MTPDQIQASYVRVLSAAQGPGELVTLVRVGDLTVYQAHAWITGFLSAELVGEVQQGERRAVVLASDVVASGFPLPFLPKQDRIVWKGKSIVIVSVDDATRRAQGVLFAYDLTLEGA